MKVEYCGIISILKAGVPAASARFCKLCASFLLPLYRKVYKFRFETAQQKDMRPQTDSHFEVYF